MTTPSALPLNASLTMIKSWPHARNSALSARRYSADPESVRHSEDLHQYLQSALQGDQILVLSNRGPYTHERRDGVVTVAQPASGLVTAIEPVVRACAGTWIAHGSGNADREFVNAADVFEVPPLPQEKTGFSLRRLWLSAEERSGYYDGFANAGLWPLCHLAHVRPTFSEAHWQHYRRVNQRFANAAAQEARSSNPVVLVQDYHLALVPAMLRQLLPRATIVSFWHIPWGNAEQMGICPWLPELVTGLQGSDIVGFQTPAHGRNFAESVQRCQPPKVSAISPAGPGPKVAPRRPTQICDFPISIAWPTPAETAAWPSRQQCRDEALACCALPPSGKLMVGIDRFDYTKGLLERLAALESLLTQQPQWLGRVCLLQVAAPTRSALPDYAEYRNKVLAEVERINARFNDANHAGCATGWRPVVMLDAHHDRAEVTALYRAADVCLVTSLHDGMNLVSKEFVAVRDDEQGVLVLSQFAGAAETMEQALIVNPYHTLQVAATLQQALAMPPAEQRKRMQALRNGVRQRNVYGWAARMLQGAAALRQSKVAQVSPLPRMQPMQHNGHLTAPALPTFGPAGYGSASALASAAGGM